MQASAIQNYRDGVGEIDFYCLDYPCHSYQYCDDYYEKISCFENDSNDALANLHIKLYFCTSF